MITGSHGSAVELEVMLTNALSSSQAYTTLCALRGSERRNVTNLTLDHRNYHPILKITSPASAIVYPNI